MNECVPRRATPLYVCEECLRKWKCVSPRARAAEIYIIVLYQLWLSEFKSLILVFAFGVMRNLSLKHSSLLKLVCQCVIYGVCILLILLRVKVRTDSEGALLVRIA
jgi:hypothetical protein